MNDKKPKPVTHHALCDLMLEAYKLTIISSLEQAEAAHDKAFDELQKACKSELKRTKRGRVMLEAIPKGVATICGRHNELEWDGDNESLTIRPSAKTASRLLARQKAVFELGEVVRRWTTGKFDGCRRKFVVDRVSASPKSMADIRKIVDKCIAEYKPVQAKAGK